MVNQLFYMKAEEMIPVREELIQEDGLFLVELDGYKMKDIDTYFAAVSQAFSFPPVKEKYDIASYLEGITDLGWLADKGYEKFALVIDQWEHFMVRSHDDEIIIALFIERILPWHSRDVELYVVGGKTRKFTIYLVD